MTGKSTPQGVVIKFRRLSWLSRLWQSRAFVVFFWLSLLCAALSAAIMLVGKHSLGAVSSYLSLPLFLLLAVAVGLVIACAVLAAARLIDRRLFGAIKTDLISAENRIIAGDCRTQMQDLEKLVMGYLKLKRLEAADYYSKRLLELSKAGPGESMHLTDWLITTECWGSSEKYHHSWSYRLFWLFETRGVLTLSPSGLDFQSKMLNFNCPVASIVSLERKRHPLWLKPVPFYYMSLTVNESGVRHVFNLTPSFGQADNLLDSNRLVDVWFKRLQTLKQKMNPAGNFPDWLKDV